jgi:type 1 glutamine amidotransferase
MSRISSLNLRLTGLVAILLCLASSAALAADPWITFEGKEGPGKGKHIVLISGDDEYRSEEGLPQLAKILSRHHGFDCTVLFEVDPQTGEIVPSQHGNIPGLEALKNADLMIILTRFRNLPDDQMKYIADYIDAGKPVLGIRTATHAFEVPAGKTYSRFNWNNARDWNGGFGRHILGETWVNHWGNHGSESTRGIIAPDMKGNPLVNGCDDIWVRTDVYEAHPTPDCKPVILGQVLKGMKPTDPPASYQKRDSKGRQQDVNNPMMPIAWIKEYKSDSGKSGRSFCTTMGAAQDLENESLRRLLVNAAYWCTGMEDKIPAKADVEIVGTYKPTRFGFDGFVKGRRPSDYGR